MFYNKLFLLIMLWINQRNIFLCDQRLNLDEFYGCDRILICSVFLLLYLKVYSHFVFIWLLFLPPKVLFSRTTCSIYFKGTYEFYWYSSLMSYDFYNPFKLDFSLLFCILKINWILITLLNYVSNWFILIFNALFQLSFLFT